MCNVNMALRLLFYFVSVLSVVSSRENDSAVLDSGVKTCKLEDTIDIQAVKSYTNGTVLSKYGYTFARDQYYNLTTRSGRTVIRGCICDIRPCVTKCTANATTFAQDHRNRTVLANNTEVVYNNIVYESNVRGFQPNFFDGKDPIENPVDYWVVVGNPCAYNKYKLMPKNYSTDVHYLQLNGSVLTLDDGMITRDMYCMDVSMSNDNETHTHRCLPKPESLAEAEQKKVIFSIHVIAALISVPFLVATFLVYLLIPKLQNIHGKSLMCHIVCLTTFYIIFSIIFNQTTMSDKWCIACALVTYYSFLGSCFWVNVMSFDIWWSFRSFNIHNRPSPSSEKKKFIYYSIYAWGMPLLLLILTIVMDFTPGINDRYRPHIGQATCWFGANLFQYFYTPMLCLILSNVIFFLTTALKIYNIQKETAILAHSGSQKHNFERENQKYKLYLKLFVLMGINWTSELISYFTGTSFYHIFDIVNCLLGVIIFALFVFKRKIIKLIIKRYEYAVDKYHLSFLLCKCCKDNQLYLAKDSSQSMSKDEQSSTKSNIKKKISDTTTSSHGDVVL